MSLKLGPEKNFGFQKKFGSEKILVQNFLLTSTELWALSKPPMTPHTGRYGRKKLGHSDLYYVDTMWTPPPQKSGIFLIGLGLVGDTYIYFPESCPNFREYTPKYITYDNRKAYFANLKHVIKVIKQLTFCSIITENKLELSSAKLRVSLS